MKTIVRATYSTRDSAKRSGAPSRSTVVGSLALLALFLTLTGTAAGAKISSDPALSAGSSSAAAQPAAQVLHGTGSRVMSIRIARNSPLVVTGKYTGAENFIVHLVGQGADEGLFNVIGSYSGQTAVADIKHGLYRVSVQGNAGNWALTFAQPGASSAATKIPATLRGYGSRVIQIRTGSSSQPIFSANYRGQENFIVHLIGIGDTSGDLSLYNEIGPYKGQVLADSSIPKGHYLLVVQADAGSWSISVKP